MPDSTTPVWAGFRGTVASTLAAFGITNAYTKAEVDALIAGVGGSAFPVGAIYTNVTGVNPATELGYGTWTAFGAGRMLAGYSAGDPDFGTILATGGAKTATPSGTVSAPTISGSTAAEASHTHSVTSNVAVAAHTFTQPTISQPTFTGDAMGTHQHEIPFQVSGTTLKPTSSATFGTGTSRAAVATITGTSNTASAAVELTQAVSAGTPTGTISTPTATGGAVDAHAVTNNAVTSGAGSSHLHGAGTLAASAPSFTGASGSILNPFIVVYFWRRTA